MSSIKDCLPQDALDALISAKAELWKTSPKQKQKRNLKRKAFLPPIEVGNIYKIEVDERNGITPPHGLKTWFKGCVVFDSEKNREHIEPGYDEFFIPISQGKYSFIDHDSFLECLRLKPATLSNIRHGKAEGRLTEDDLQKALELTKKSNRNSIMTLKAFNIE